MSDRAPPKEASRFLLFPFQLVRLSRFLQHILCIACSLPCPSLDLLRDKQQEAQTNQTEQRSLGTAETFFILNKRAERCHVNFSYLKDSRDTQTVCASTIWQLSKLWANPSRTLCCAWFERNDADVLVGRVDGIGVSKQADTASR